MEWDQHTLTHARFYQVHDRPRPRRPNAPAPLTRTGPRAVAPSPPRPPPRRVPAQRRAVMRASAGPVRGGAAPGRLRLAHRCGASGAAQPAPPPPPGCRAVTASAPHHDGRQQFRGRAPAPLGGGARVISSARYYVLTRTVRRAISVDPKCC